VSVIEGSLLFAFILIHDNNNLSLKLKFNIENEINNKLIDFKFNLRIPHMYKTPLQFQLSLTTPVVPSNIINRRKLLIE
jgi:hypothetical protein